MLITFTLTIFFSRSGLSPSPVPLAPAPLLTQQAQRLLEEARNENRMLESTVSDLRAQLDILEQVI